MIPEWQPCREQEPTELRDAGCRKARLRCNRPHGHAGLHRHYTKAAEIVAEWATA